MLKMTKVNFCVIFIVDKFCKNLRGAPVITSENQ